MERVECRREAQACGCTKEEEQHARGVDVGDAWEC